MIPLSPSPTQVMSSELEAMADAMFTQRVPEMWEARAYPSMKPLGAWVQELLDRLHFLQAWIDAGIPPVFWISGFFFPQVSRSRDQCCARAALVCPSRG